MKTANVMFANSDYNYSTSINGTNQEIISYFLEKFFNVGIYPKEKMRKCIGVDIGEDTDTYVVYRVFFNHDRKRIIDEGLTRAEAIEMVKSYPSDDRQMVVFDKE